MCTIELSVLLARSRAFLYPAGRAPDVVRPSDIAISDWLYKQHMISHISPSFQTTHRTNTEGRSQAGSSPRMQEGDQRRHSDRTGHLLAALALAGLAGAAGHGASASSVRAGRDHSPLGAFAVAVAAVGVDDDSGL